MIRQSAGVIHTSQSIQTNVLPKIRP